MLLIIFTRIDLVFFAMDCVGISRVWATLNIRGRGLLNYRVVSRTARLLLVSERLNRVKVCRFLRRVPTEENAGEGTNGKAEHDAPRLDADGPLGNRLYGVGDEATDNNANDAARDAEENGFYQELRQDVNATRTDRHTQTDFLGALRYADIHDVHNTDTTHDE